MEDLELMQQCISDMEAISEKSEDAARRSDILSKVKIMFNKKKAIIEASKE